ncbi:MAG: AbrB/MazE/SpoVT family DNA-binding domain-containing protein [Candidatus Omnitrophica bacterium]|nr:AbrB/MazE/SpoVT family DNA-binding domain-containing protein [Candidatus Omnitrophota bacterium]
MKITEKGQVTIPKPIRERHGLYPGTEVRFVEREHRVVVEKAHAADPWERYRGFLKLRKRSDEVIRILRGPRP